MSPVKIKQNKRTIATVRDAMKQLFPNGYLCHAGYEALIADRNANPALCTDFSQPPCRSVDLFALAGFLLMKSGGYHRIAPYVTGVTSPQMVIIKEVERKAWTRIGKEWRGEKMPVIPSPPAELLEFWAIVIQYLHRPIYVALGPGSKARPWWRAAMALLAIADEASRDIGFETGKPKSAQAVTAEAQMRSVTTGKGVYTLSTADFDQVCILPKSRTPKVGCTLRSLSHHLALLPPRGMARAYWRPHSQEIAKSEMPSVAAPFNVVVIPLPFEIRANAFKSKPSGDARWGWFHVDPHWCPDSATVTDKGFKDFWRFVEGVLDKASEDVGIVHGLIFPETALSHEVFRRLCDQLNDRPGFELIVSGLFDFSEGSIRRDGNFAAMARRRQGNDGVSTFDTSIRDKHHRWRVEKSQIESYSLGSALDCNRGWWENLDILDRSLDVFVIRGGATVTTLICEDLARSEPCQELVRGIGPNLVIALLMDGPQLRDRWPARYATVLAEDPGSSVLTVTSMGLINRTNKSGQYPASDKIGLWRDDSGRTVELSLGKDAQALLLTLQPSELKERTLDGRDDAGGAQSWRLTGMIPVIPSGEQNEILSGDWPGGLL